jgi:uncharacterized membrane protein YuzA (DUF378 family)
MSWKNILLILYIVICWLAAITGVKMNSVLGTIIYVPAGIILLADIAYYFGEKEKKEKEREGKFYRMMDKIFNELENIRHDTENLRK